MERMGIRRRVYPLMLTALILSGCSSIETNDEVTSCTVPVDSLTPATVDPSQEGYDQSRDPSFLAVKMEAEAEAIQDSDNSGWEINFRNQVVGLGEVACLGADGETYLTPEGARLSYRFSG